VNQACGLRGAGAWHSGANGSHRLRTQEKCIVARLQSRAPLPWLSRDPSLASGVAPTLRVGGHPWRPEPKRPRAVVVGCGRPTGWNPFPNHSRRPRPSLTPSQGHPRASSHCAGLLPWGVGTPPRPRLEQGESCSGTGKRAPPRPFKWRRESQLGARPSESHVRQALRRAKRGAACGITGCGGTPARAGPISLRICWLRARMNVRAAGERCVPNEPDPVGACLVGLTKSFAGRSVRCRKGGRW
jgi:hypothetical protein